MPLISHFKATTVWKAFTLNALASAFIVLIGVTAKDKLDRYFLTDGGPVDRHTSIRSIIYTFILTFAAAFLSFTILHFLTGYGGGMTVPS